MFGGKVEPHTHREYGFAQVQVLQAPSSNTNPLANKLFAGFGESLKVWMSHGDQIADKPPSFDVIGKTPTAPFAAIVHHTKPIFGVQFHPEVTHSDRGKEVIGHFILDVCECKTNWTMVRCEWLSISRIKWAVGNFYRQGDCSN